MCTPHTAQWEWYLSCKALTLQRNAPSTGGRSPLREHIPHHAHKAKH